MTQIHSDMNTETVDPRFFRLLDTYVASILSHDQINDDLFTSVQSYIIGNISNLFCD